MDNLLEIDLNKLVSKQVAGKISSLEKELTNSQNKNLEQYKEIIELKKQVDNSKIALGLFEYLRDEFSKIKQSEADSGGWFKSKQQNQFLFIEGILLNIFNIKKEAKGWYCTRNDGNLASHLAVNFYSKKETVIDLLKIIMADCRKEVAFIESFKMPFDYTKEEVIQYVKEPKFNTNGCIFGISEYWIRYGVGKRNMPHDLIMKSPFILEEDVFEILLDSIKKKVSNYYYLFTLPKYNKNISEEQLIKLGECLTSMTTRELNCKVVNGFISENLNSFNNKTLDFLYNLIQSDDLYKTVYWENFPTEYQMRFLKAKPLDEILSLLAHYKCKWTIEQKESFLKEYIH